MKNPDLASWCCRQILSDEIPVDTSPTLTDPEVSHGNAHGDKMHILNGGPSILRGRDENLANVFFFFVESFRQMMENAGSKHRYSSLFSWILHLKLLNSSLSLFPACEEKLILSAFTSEGLWGQSLEKNLPSMQRIHKWLQGKKTPDPPLGNSSTSRLLSGSGVSCYINILEALQKGWHSHHICGAWLIGLRVWRMGMERRRKWNPQGASWASCFPWPVLLLTCWNRVLEPPVPLKWGLGTLQAPWPSLHPSPALAGGREVSCSAQQPPRQPQAVTQRAAQGC